MSGIKRTLPNNQYQAALNAISPSAANPFITESELPASENLGTNDLVSSDSIRTFTLYGTTSSDSLQITDGVNLSALFSFKGDGEFDIHGGGYNGINFTKWGVSSYLKQGYDGWRYLRLQGHDRLYLFGGDGGASVETSMYFENNIVSGTAREFNQKFSYGASDNKFKFILDPVTGFNDLELAHVGARNNGIWCAKGGFQSTTATPPTARANNFGLHTALNSGSVVPMFTLENGDQIKLFKQTLPVPASVSDIVTLLTNLGLV
jgi:hypothetical protein